MKKGLIACTTAMLVCQTAFAVEDTAIHLNNVVTTANRLDQPLTNVTSDISVIDADQINRAGQSTFVELLQLQPGIEISSNGGAGAQSSIFMRGTNSNQVIVLIDGMRVMSATAGLATWENIPLSIIDKIEILRGPASSLYGADAIGGVIQIFTKKGNGPSQAQIYADLGYGSDNTIKGDAGIHGRINDTSYALSATASHTNGFSALDTTNPNISDNDGYQNTAFSLNLSQKLADVHEIGVQLFNSSGTTHFDNIYNLTPYDSRSKLNQQVVAITANDPWTTFWQSHLRVGFSEDKYKNFDETSFYSPINPTLFNTKQTQINWQNDLKLSVGTLSLAYERLEDQINSTTSYDKTNRINHGFVASYLASIDSQNIQLSLRDDHNSQFGSSLTGGVGYGYRLNSHWRATANYGTAFKTPTFNDLYWPGFSNPQLQPEKSRNIEASLRYQTNNTHASATIYDNHIRNLIAFDAVNYTIANLDKAHIQGLTLVAGGRISDISIESNVDFQSPHNEENNNLLPRRAKNFGKLSASYDWRQWRLGGELFASSARYNDASNSIRLGGYSLVNITAEYKLNNDWHIQARANNILDKKYVLATTASAFDRNAPDYNTPGANLFVNVRYQPE